MFRDSYNLYYMGHSAVLYSTRVSGVSKSYNWTVYNTETWVDYTAGIL